MTNTNKKLKNTGARVMNAAKKSWERTRNFSGLWLQMAYQAYGTEKQNGTCPYTPVLKECIRLFIALQEKHFSNEPISLADLKTPEAQEFLEDNIREKIEILKEFANVGAKKKCQIPEEQRLEAIQNIAEVSNAALTGFKLAVSELPNTSKENCYAPDFICLLGVCFPQQLTK